MSYSEVYNIRHLAFHFRRRLVFDCGFFSIQFEDFFKNRVEMKKKHENKTWKNVKKWKFFNFRRFFKLV